MDDFLTVNQNAWDNRTELHLESDFYDLPGFLAGNTSLREIELAELDVRGKSLLHLQCHFGQDTLSWARAGAASVTGLDLSPKAIAAATSIASELKLDDRADFVCGNVLDARALVQGEFELVYSSYGVLCWLPDLTAWANTIASCLKPGGLFFLAEFHPIKALMDGYDYFHTGKADVEQEGSYTENSREAENTMVSWSHDLGEVVSALINAGLVIESLREYDFSPYDCFDNLLEEEPGRFRQRLDGKPLPLVFSIKARKPLV
ncbi:class I SAM-dependent methyltransferase [Shewanella khirikhana]|uniref:Bifunctional 3-demethylubiquinone-9 3-methyltransferase/ 2-octaprenyl-6-hydroxy phenol methylase n=1 Tax=Shewanella khirikhana TaxID=1965282 RepID=A0ABM7DT41_9GAMM|nr:class I SAM-dependent methyltransferase [Shewanella khirikhana]AZQ12880.1 bifunctional 3-demethylubiquinone-9 3-methyltransferase/ 2-octaprenyl-6-hydroxy phenol methylase [Shewanella khirikhana]